MQLTKPRRTVRSYNGPVKIVRGVASDQLFARIDTLRVIELRVFKSKSGNQIAKAFASHTLIEKCCFDFTIYRDKVAIFISIRSNINSVGAI